MSKIVSPIEKSAGKLISSIQKEWGLVLGEDCATESEDVMDKAHDILQASKNDGVVQLLDGRSISEYLGSVWVKKHPAVIQYINSVKALL